MASLYAHYWLILHTLRIIFLGAVGFQCSVYGAPLSTGVSFSVVLFRAVNKLICALFMCL